MLYKKSYADRHDVWWRASANHPVWTWQPPPVAASRHLGLDESLRQLRNSRDRAERSRCRGLGVLEFHPMCACGFDGEKAAIAEELGRFESIRAEIERGTREFFADEEVRARVGDWVREGVESEPGAAAYVNGERPYPDVSNLGAFDRHLAGVEVVKELSLSALHDLLGERAWERKALVQAFDEFTRAGGADRIRFAKESLRERTGVLAWCAEAALRFAAPLPQGLGSSDLEAIAEALRPEWVSHAALRDLSSLRLGEEAVDRIALWLATGEVRAPAGSSLSPPAAAAIEVFSPRDPPTPRGLATLSETLYGEHSRMMRVARDRWLERLERLARAPLEGKVPDLTDLLAARGDSQWVVLDCLGVPLLSTLLRELPELFGDWSDPAVEFGLAPARTTTDEFYRGILAAGIDHGFEKITRVDTLLHERFLPFEDISRLAAAELRAAGRAVRKRLDPARPLLVFADHGFRIAKDGRSYQHGGGSTLERLVPVIQLGPR